MQQTQIKDVLEEYRKKQQQLYDEHKYKKYFLVKETIDRINLLEECARPNPAAFGGKCPRTLD